MKNASTRLRALLLNDFWLKLLALAISFSLWTAYTAEPFAQVGFNVPLEYVNVPNGLAISGVSSGDVPAAAVLFVM